MSGTSLVTMDASYYTKTLHLHSLGVATRTLSVAQCFLVFTFMIYFYYASSRLPSRLPFRKKNIILILSLRKKFPEGSHTNR